MCADYYVEQFDYSKPNPADHLQPVRVLSCPWSNFAVDQLLAFNWSNDRPYPCGSAATSLIA